MSEWNQMTPREKAEYIVQNVMQWKYFPEWKLIHTARWVLEGNVTYPYAFWNDQQEGVAVFYHESEDACPFNPLEDMSAAWHIVNHFGGPNIGSRTYNDFYVKLRGLCKSDPFGDDTLHPLWLFNITPERICQATYDTFNEGNQ